MFIAEWLIRQVPKVLHILICDWLASKLWVLLAYEDWLVYLLECPNPKIIINRMRNVLTFGTRNVF